MIEQGKMHTLTVVGKTSSQIYLQGEREVQELEVALPVKRLPHEVKLGDQLQVFVYHDRQGLVASLKKPTLLAGEIASLKVVDVTEFGAFLDWGIEQDLLLPLKEQKGRLFIGESYLVTTCLNRNGRLCATMKIYDHLSKESPYQEKDRVKGTVYQIHEELGAFVAVENQFHGLIPKKELYGHLKLGQQVELRIKKRREDGKLECSLREEIPQQIEKDATRILKRIHENHGVLHLNDHSSPEQIRHQLLMSKSAFKRAVGRLIKEGAVKENEEGLRLLWEGATPETKELT